MTESDEFQLGFQEAPVALMILAYRRMRRVNAEFEALFGWTQSDIEGQSVRLLYPSNLDYEKSGRRWAQRLAGQLQHEDERFMRCASGRTLWLRARGRTLTPDTPFRLTLWAFDPLPDRLAGLDLLTLREREVARHVVNGFTSKEIGQTLGISPRTVEVHRAALMRKLGVTRVSALVNQVTTRS